MRAPLITLLLFAPLIAMHRPAGIKSELITKKSIVIKKPIIAPPLRNCSQLSLKELALSVFIVRYGSQCFLKQRFEYLLKEFESPSEYSIERQKELSGECRKLNKRLKKHCVEPEDWENRNFTAKNISRDIALLSYACVKRFCQEINARIGHSFPTTTPQSLPAAQPLDHIIAMAHERHRPEIIKIIQERYYCAFKWPALCLLAGAGYAHSCQILLSDYAANINCLDYLGRTPLHTAACRRNEQIVRLLLSYDRLDPFMRDRDGKSALCLARENGHEAIAKLIEEEMKKRVKN